MKINKVASTSLKVSKYTLKTTSLSVGAVRKGNEILQTGIDSSKDEMAVLNEGFKPTKKTFSTANKVRRKLTRRYITRPLRRKIFGAVKNKLTGVKKAQSTKSVGIAKKGIVSAKQSVVASKGTVAGAKGMIVGAKGTVATSKGVVLGAKTTALSVKPLILFGGKMGIIASKGIAVIGAGLSKSLTALALLGGKILAVALTIVMLTSIIVMVIGLFWSSYEEAHNGANGFVQAAIREYETFTEADRGGLRYRNWFGLHGHWCVMFISYVANEVGLIEAGIIPRSASVMQSANWYRERGLFWDSAENRQIRAGDIVFFQRPGESHASIVVEVCEESQRIVTIGGNEGHQFAHVTSFQNSLVRRTSMLISNPRITGFARPNFFVIPSNDDVMLLAGILQAEALPVRAGKLAVGTIIMNRLHDPRFPNSIHDVIFQEGQFQPTWTGRLDTIMANGPSALSIEVAQAIIDGERDPRLDGFFFFLQASTTSRQGINIHGNLFFREW